MWRKSGSGEPSETFCIHINDAITSIHLKMHASILTLTFFTYMQLSVFGRPWTREIFRLPPPPHPIFFSSICWQEWWCYQSPIPLQKNVKKTLFWSYRTLQILEVLPFLWRKSPKIATLPQNVPYNSDMWQKPALFATIACLQQDLLSQIISNYDLPVKNVHLRGVRYPIITSVSHRVSLKKLLCSAISLEIMVALNIWKAIDKCSQCQVMHQTARNIIF